MKCRSRALSLLSLACLLATPARSQAEIVRASPDSFLVVEEATTSVLPDRAVAGFADIGQWWNAEHTYSGSSRSLHLDLTAGGCFCETWVNGSIEHARVLLVLNGKTVRMKGALGPLQGMAVDAILDFTAVGGAEPGTAKLKLSYLVNGASTSQLDKVAPAVDGVLKNALQRLSRYLDTGKASD